MQTVEQFRNAMAGAGLAPPDVIHADGKLHRFTTNGKRSDAAGWYCLHGDNLPAGAFGDWRQGGSHTWCSKDSATMTQEERDAYDADVASAETNAAYLATLPVQEPRGFEVPYVVFLDATNRQKGIAMEIMETGDQIFYVFHSSPVDWEKVDSNRKAAIARARARRARVEDAKAKGANANSVPALREAFSNLCVELNRPWIIPGN